jgi:rubrerythrin
MFDKLKAALGFETEPRWKRRLEFYYACPECDGVAVNAKWRVRDIETDEVVFEYRGRTHYRKELHYLCPMCDELVPYDDVHSLDEIAHFEDS